MRIIAQTAVVHLEVPDHPPILHAARPAAHPAAVAEINEGGHRMTVKFHLERDDSGAMGAFGASYRRRRSCVNNMQ